jgi:hypothetical protein
MKLVLKCLFAVIFVVMVWINVKAMLAMNILASFPLFSANPWAVATLYDAYCGFVTFWVWVAYKERASWAKGLWFLLVMGLGNVAMSAYVLKELFKLRPEEPVWNLLLRRA